MTKEEREKAIRVLDDMKVKIDIPKAAVMQNDKNWALDMAIKTLEQEPCEDKIIEWKKNFKEYINALSIPRDDYKGIIEYIDELTVTPTPKTGYISINNVMSVFDDFMCGEVDEDGIDTFLKMLKDEAESEE